MARGSSRAQSELSDRLQEKARALRKQNKDELKEVEDNQNEYERARKYAVSRAEEEVAEEFAKKKLEVDEDEQARREAEADQAEKEAQAELDRERTDEQKREIFEAKVANDVGSSAMTYGNWENAQWWQTLERAGDANLKRLEPSVYTAAEDRLYLSNDYIKAAVDKAPKSIRQFVETGLKCFQADGKFDSFPGERAERLYNGLSNSYNITAFGPGNTGRVDPDYFIDSRDLESLTEKKHAAGMAALNKTDTYIAKVLKGAGKHLVDFNGKSVV